MSAAVFEFDPRPDHQILDRARDQHFVCTSPCHDARAYMNRDTADCISNEFTLARMKPGPDL